MKKRPLGPQCDSFVIKSDPSPGGILLVELAVRMVEAGSLDDERSKDPLARHRDRLTHCGNGVLLSNHCAI